MKKIDAITTRTSSTFDRYYNLLTGADPGFFLGGGAPLRNGVTDR